MTISFFWIVKIQGFGKLLLQNDVQHSNLAFDFFSLLLKVYSPVNFVAEWLVHLFSLLIQNVSLDIDIELVMLFKCSACTPGTTWYRNSHKCLLEIEPVRGSELPRLTTLAYSVSGCVQRDWVSRNYQLELGV